MANRIDHKGKKLGHLYFLEPIRFGGKGVGAIWKVRCDCGSEVELPARRIVSGRQKTCGKCVYSRRLKSDRSRRVWEQNKNRRRAYREQEIEAQRKHILWGIEPEEFIRITDMPCHFCNTPSTDQERSRLNRVDMTKTYQPENVVPACGLCRGLRAGRNYQLFLEQIERIANYRARTSST